MILFSILLLALSLLAGSVQAGSRHWEVHHSKLAARAVSVIPGDSVKDTRLWPKRTLTYAFANSNAKVMLKGIFHSATQHWNLLKGFNYNEISLTKCNEKRTECLVVNYNNEGRLSSTVAIPALDASDPSYVGPVMHLSDRADVGHLDVNVNAAHELGHAWGLYHEHQVPRWWKTSPQDLVDTEVAGWRSVYYGSIFHTNKYRCENLRGFDTAKASLARELKRTVEELTVTDINVLCRQHNTARRHKFFAVEWVPIDGLRMNWDESFDPQSLMLYPSGSGGVGGIGDDGTDNRMPVLLYSDDSKIEIKTGPSTADVKRLQDLYGVDAKGKSTLHNEKGNLLSGTLKRLRSMVSLKAGDTRQGLC
ncbi:hypothetical protein Neosp_012804 [[Neocosmospora] mangrovei]